MYIHLSVHIKYYVYIYSIFRVFILKLIAANKSELFRKRTNHKFCSGSPERMHEHDWLEFSRNSIINRTPTNPLPSLEIMTNQLFT